MFNPAQVEAANKLLTIIRLQKTNLEHERDKISDEIARKETEIVLLEKAVRESEPTSGR